MNKQTAINLCKQVKEKYLNPWKQYFFKKDSCPICSYLEKVNLSVDNCEYCFLQKPIIKPTDKYCGCDTFESFNEAFSEMNDKLNVWHKYPSKEKFPGILKSFKKRAEFYQNVIEYLETLEDEELDVVKISEEIRRRFK